MMVAGLYRLEDDLVLVDYCPLWTFYLPRSVSFLTFGFTCDPSVVGGVFLVVNLRLLDLSPGSDVQILVLAGSLHVHWTESALMFAVVLVFVK